jgi:hypothetical protein
MRKFYLLFALATIAIQGLNAQTCTNAPSAGPCTGGNVTENFNDNSSSFTSASFTYNAGNGNFEVNPAARNSSYTLTSGIFTLSASGGNMGFSVTGSTSSILNVVVRIRDAATNAILFTCTQTAANFISAGQICIQFSGLTPGTAVRYEFVITTVNGAAGDGTLVFDNFSNGGSAAALPAKLDNFEAAKDGSGIKVSWTAATETGVMAYEIQRSVDGINFVTIGSVKAESKRTYSYVDALPVATNNFYRLRIVDFDNKARISHIVSIKSKVNASIEVYPNPVRNTTVVQHPKASSGSRMQVVNLNGQVLIDMQLAPNTVVTPLNLTGLKGGTYYVVFRSGTETVSQRVTKQ